VEREAYELVNQKSSEVKSHSDYEEIKIPIKMTNMDSHVSS